MGTLPKYMFDLQQTRRLTYLFTVPRGGETATQETRGIFGTRLGEKQISKFKRTLPLS